MKKLFTGTLWKDRNFMRLWAGLSVSLVGSEVTVLALPTIALLLLGASSFEVGALRAVETIAFPVLGLFAGVWADRLDPRRIMVVSNMIRLLALLSIPAAALIFDLTMIHLFLVALLLGVCTVFFNVSYATFMPRMVKREDLVDGNAKITLSQSAAKVAGPGVAGWLIGAVGAVQSIVVDAVGYLFAAVMLMRIKTEEPKRAAGSNGGQAGFWSMMGDGIRLVFGNPILRSLMIITGCMNFGFSMVQPMLLLFAYQELELSAGQVGIILALGSTGFVAGALVAKRVTLSLGLGKSLFFTSSLMGLSLAGLAFANFGSPVVLLTAFWFLTSLALPIYDINAVTLRQSVTPTELQGRMNATMRTVIWGAIPLGAMLGGLITGAAGVTVSILIGGGVVFLSSFLILFSNLIKLRETPAEPTAVLPSKQAKKGR